MQVFDTAVTLKRHVIEEAVETFKKKADTHDSLFLVTEETGWLWGNQTALNYDPTKPNGLPRSQDACYYKETTGLYAITRDSLFSTGCRIGLNPFLFIVDKTSALDIDTMDDLKAAELALQNE